MNRATIPDEANEQRDRERYRTAIHEAGHAVVALALGHGIRNVMAGTGYGNCVLAHGYRSVVSAAAIIRAGEAAELLHTGFGSFEAASGDRANLAAITADPSVREAGWRDARRILEANPGAVVRLAERLFAAFTLTGAEVVALVGTLNTRGF